MSRGLRSLAAVAGLAAALVQPAHAGPELINNGGFETGSFSGWTPTGDQTFNGVQCPGPSSVVFSGNCSAFFGPVGTTGGISQTLSGLLTDRFYNVSFAFEPDGGTPSSFSALFGAQTLLSRTNPAGGPYSLFSFSIKPTSSTQTLAFTFRDDPGFLNLDAVSVSVPEPASIALLGIGLAGLWVGRRRKPAA
jgi:hypothetical protein